MSKGRMNDLTDKLSMRFFTYCFNALLGCQRHISKSRAPLVSPHPRPRLTSHWLGCVWFLSWISQSCWPSHTAQWCMVMMTGRVNRAPGGPQLTTGLSTVWPSSTEGLEGHTHTQSGFSGSVTALSVCVGDPQS